MEETTLPECKRQELLTGEIGICQRLREEINGPIKANTLEPLSRLPDVPSEWSKERMSKAKDITELRVEPKQQQNNRESSMDAFRPTCESIQKLDTSEQLGARIMFGHGSIEKQEFDASARNFYQEHCEKDLHMPPLQWSGFHEK